MTVIPQYDFHHTVIIPESYYNHTTIIPNIIPKYDDYVVSQYDESCILRYDLSMTNRITSILLEYEDDMTTIIREYDRTVIPQYDFHHTVIIPESYYNHTAHDYAHFEGNDPFCLGTGVFSHMGPTYQIMIRMVNYARKYAEGVNYAY